MLLDFLVMFAGVAAILVLAEIVIRLTVRLASHFNLSGTFIGLTILSVGTSLLEIMTHVVGSIHILRDPAQLNTLSAMLLGSNVGSDIFQQNIVLPLVAFLGTVTVVRRDLTKEVGALIAASGLLWLACLGGTVTRWEGALLVLAYLMYLGWLGRDSRDGSRAARQRLTRARVMQLSGFVVAIFAGMAALASPVLDAATRLVAHLPVSASMFGVIVLGVCAALPELATALVSIAKGQREISAGILIGSNITNPLFSAGLGAMISGYTVPGAVLWYDLPVKIATGCLLFGFLWRHSRLGRGAGLTLVALYFGYTALRGVLFPLDF